MSAQITEALGKLDVMISDAANGNDRAVATAATAAPDAASAAVAPAGGDGVASIRAELASMFTASIAAALPMAAGEAAAVAVCGNPQFGDYQCNNAMALFGKLKGKVSSCPGGGSTA